eukprot:2623540-Rhodomonas_salina.2
MSGTDLAYAAPQESVDSEPRADGGALFSYAPAMRCPRMVVGDWRDGERRAGRTPYGPTPGPRMVLHVCYAMSGTESRVRSGNSVFYYAMCPVEFGKDVPFCTIESGTNIPLYTSESGTDILFCTTRRRRLSLAPPASLPLVHSAMRLRPYSYYHCLRFCTDFAGCTTFCTDVAGCTASFVLTSPGCPASRAAVSSDICLRACYAVSDTDLAYASTRMLRDVRYWPSVCCYARATRCARMLLPAADPLPLAGGGERGSPQAGACYKMSGTGIAYAATCVLRDARYWHTVCCYRVLGDVRNWHTVCTVCCYVRATPCPVLAYCLYCMMLSLATRCPVLSCRMVLPVCGRASGHYARRAMGRERGRGG